ncbi:unnamed protein product [Absidia cylindrospora]
MVTYVSESSTPAPLLDKHASQCRFEPNNQADTLDGVVQHESRTRRSHGLLDRVFGMTTRLFSKRGLQARMV